MSKDQIWYDILQILLQAQTGEHKAEPSSEGEHRAEPSSEGEHRAGPSSEGEHDVGLIDIQEMGARKGMFEVGGKGKRKQNVLRRKGLYIGDIHDLCFRTSHNILL